MSFNTIVNRTKAVFAVLMMLWVVTVVVSALGVHRMNEALTRINDVNAVKQRHAINFRGSVHDRAIALRDVALLDRSGDVEAEVALIARLAQAYRRSDGPLRTMIADRSSRTELGVRQVAAIEEIEAKIEPLIERIIALKTDGRSDDARRLLMDEAKPLFTAWLDAINAFIDHQEALNGQETAIARDTGRLLIIGLLVGFGAAAVGGGVLILRTLRSIGRLTAVTDIVTELSNGRYDIAIPKRQGRDEIASILAALEVFQQNAQRAVRLDRERDDERDRQATRSAKVKRAVEGFETAVDGVIGELRGAANGLLALSDKLNRDMDGAEDRARSVADVSHKALQRMEAVAGATEQLTASIRTTASDVNETAVSARSCSSFAKESREKLDKLQAAVQEIDGVIQAISDVAEQTNLLALNATIESARAGEAGRGFAVVAGEVKSLANETRKMTDEIGQRVGGIRENAFSTIESVAEIVRQISAVDGRTQNIAAAVEQQTVSTSEIAGNVQGVAEGARRVDSDVNRMSETIRDSQNTARDVGTASKDLAGVSDRLSTAVVAFLKDVQAVA